MAHPNTYVGLDIGTTKISTIIAEKEDIDFSFNVLNDVIGALK